MARFKNEHVSGSTHVGGLEGKAREASLRWFGHILRRDTKYIGRKVVGGLEEDQRGDRCSERGCDVSWHER